MRNVYALVNGLLLGLVIILGSYLVGLFVSYYIFPGEQITTTPAETHDEITRLQQKLKEVDISATNVLVYDLRHEAVLLEKNSDEVRPLASLVKLATGLVSLEHLSNPVSIHTKAVRQYGDSGLTIGSNWPVSSLVSFMLVNSSNDAAYALADAFDEKKGIPRNFFYTLHDFTRTIGAERLYTFSPEGLDYPNDEATAFGSAWDVLALLRTGMNEYPQIFANSAEKKHVYTLANGASHVAVNTNQVVSRLPSLRISKTGYTYSAGGNIAFVFTRKESTPVAVILLGSTFEGRFKDARRITTAIVHR